MKIKVLVTVLALLVLGQAQDTPDPCPQVGCLPGTAVNCLLDPCTTQRCPLYPDATCCSNTCGGCNYNFMTSSGEDVTTRCAQNATCPLRDFTGSCDEPEYTCRADADCSDSRVCCNSGCGTSCQDPVDQCALVLCAIPLCLPGFTPVTPEGECCPVCRPTQTCPDPSTVLPVTSLTGSDACPQACSDDTSCTLNRVCCHIDSCSGNVCVSPVSGCTLEDGTVVAEGATRRPDDCTVCTCLRNGTISCERTCIRQCPDASSLDQVGICIIDCMSDDDCTEDSYCCENSCGGAVCLTLDLMCRTRDGDLVSPGDTFMVDCNTCTCGDDGAISCTETACPERGCPAPSGTIPADASCEFNGDTSCECRERQICCPMYRDCDLVLSCVDPVILCRHDDGTTVQIGTTYSPPSVCETCSCGENGELSCEPRDACQGCDVEDVRYALGSPVPSDDCNTCTCTETGVICTLIACENMCRGPDGGLVAIGDTVDAPDGCNTCTCTAERRLACTEIFCVDRCFQPAAVGDCDAAIPRYWFDQTQGVCSMFTWGGCGGNRNNFETIGECLRACNNMSTCLATIYPRDMEPLCLIASQQRWTFDLESGRCREVGYIPCQTSEGFNVYETEEECMRTCIGGEPEGECPPDVPIVFCLADPCVVNSCPNFPEAKCEANYCGGCNAVFYDSDGTDITDRCVSGPTCEDGTPVVQCFVSPCDVSRCPGVPGASCQANYCGGCNAWYFDNDGNNVTDRCGENRPTPLEFLQCPIPESDVVGICQQSCSTNDNCTGGMLCCSNGCGHTCQIGDSIPYYPLPTSCPVPDSLGSCDDVDDDDSCLVDDECSDDGELCCRSGCGGRTCEEAVSPSRPCQAVIDALDAFFSDSLFGVFRPGCLADGSFAPTQCHGSYCWCVHTRTGVPTSPRSPIGTLPTCITCPYQGVTYYPGQSFPASDGCNTCWCTDNGGVACTRIGCEVPTRCSAEPDPGLCRGSFPAYYYDYEDDSCKRFTYGGCGGNDNKYQTVRDCLRSCNPQSLCLLPAAPGLCEAYNPSYFFNSTSDRCEPFVYGGCQGNDNRFPRGESCLDKCSPDGEYVESCQSTPCGPPVCPPGSRFVSDDDTCCGGTCTEIECEDDEKLCRDGLSCVHVRRICDVVEDCDDGSDERDCPEPPSECAGFLCGTGECLPDDFRCDNYIDCRDRSDEQGCNRLPPNTQYISETPRECPAVTDRLVDCEDDSCSANTDCEDDDDELCCPTSCGENQCTRGRPIVPLCQTLRRTRMGMADTFVPECDGDGTFAPVQCHDNYCWCVDISDGYPVTEGTRERPTCGCQLRDDDANSLIPFGDTYRDMDGCNTCFCTPEWPLQEFCTNDRCAMPCSINEVRVEHQGLYEDECIACKCSFGALNCTRKDCSSIAPVRQPTRVRMPFNGDFDSLVTDDNAKEELEREVIRTLLTMYKDSINLKQEQITAVMLEKGSVIVTVELTDSTDVTSANLTILLSQLEQDFGSGIIVIRFGSSVLQPTGDLVVAETADMVAVAPWVIAVIVVAIAVIAIVAVIVAAIVCCRSRGAGKGPQYSGSAGPNDYDSKVAYTKTDDAVKVPLD